MDLQARANDMGLSLTLPEDYQRIGLGVPDPQILLLILLALNGINASGGATTIANGADVAEGSTTDAVVAAGAAGTVSAKLRRLTTDLDALKTANHTDLLALATALAATATATKQDAGNISLASIDAQIASLATLAKQDTQIAHLSDISNVLSGEVTPNFLLIGPSGSQNIPAHAKGYGFAFFTGTGTVNGQAVPAGYTVSDERTIANAITITTDTDSTAIIRWNT